MKRVKLTEDGKYGVKITIDDIYEVYTTEEVLNMKDVSNKEKRSVQNINSLMPVFGWIEGFESSEDRKIFIQVYEEHILEEMNKMKKCKFCGTIKDLKPINNKEAYICIDCLHKQTREGKSENAEYDRKNIIS